MKLVVVGLNHKTAPLEIREKIAFSEEKIREALKVFAGSRHVIEAAILSTCNRVEIYGVTKEISSAISEIKDFLSQLHPIPLSLLEPHLYHHSDEEAVLHGFRVASSLDSMVLGEPQILGQMKEAYQFACEGGRCGPLLNRYFPRVFNVAKKVRTETEIASGPVNVSYVAVLLAKKIFGEFEGRKVLLLGAGKMSELAARHLKSQGVSEIWVANRSFERAQEMAKSCGGHAVYFDDFLLSLPLVDMVITSTASEDYIFRPEQVQEAMRLRKNRPLFMIDIAVPRNIDPEINKIYNVYLYDLDDLQGVVQASQKDRLLEAEKAETLVRREMKDFMRSLETFSVVPTIHLLSQKIDHIRKRELEKALSRLKELTPEQKAVLEDLTSALVNKILHDLLLVLKTEQLEVDPSRQTTYSEVIHKLFRL